DGYQHQPETILLQIMHNVLLKLRSRQSASAGSSPDELTSPPELETLVVRELPESSCFGTSLRQQ
ncbi:MAG: hypothetical protein KAG66_07945, partial [Methylococcales bacterium]|nr:hypothetical protein [Methylococcales bacterium]